MRLVIFLILMITIKTNIAEVLQPLVAKVESLNGGELQSTVLRTVATSMLGVVRTRIHEQGLGADGSDIGAYSKEPIYVSLKSNPGRALGKPTGKTGRSVFKSTGQPHRSKYFAGGYNEYKTSIGRNQLGKVNLSLSGQMNSQLSVVATANNGYGLGWPNDEMFRRAGYLEAKYKKKIWALSDDETTQATAVAQNVISGALSE